MKKLLTFYFYANWLFINFMSTKAKKGRHFLQELS